MVVSEARAEQRRGALLSPSLRLKAFRHSLPSVSRHLEWIFLIEFYVGYGSFCTH